MNTKLGELYEHKKRKINDAERKFMTKASHLSYYGVEYVVVVEYQKKQHFHRTGLFHLFFAEYDHAIRNALGTYGDGFKCVVTKIDGDKVYDKDISGLAYAPPEDEDNEPHQEITVILENIKNLMEKGFLLSASSSVHIGNDDS